MKCWHCGNKTRNYSDAFISFAINDKALGFGEWQEKRIWLCNYCYENLRRNYRRSKKKTVKPIIIKGEPE